jgi:hypothetical protein
MGMTIAYRGRLADLTRVEDFEDRLLDLALELGGLGRVWRGQADDDPQRMVRGVILNLAPGLEPLSLAVAPEGWLVGLADLEDAERGRLTEPPWCWTKTQFGPIEGHVAVVEVLAALAREFLPALEVLDEGGYWETRDLAELSRRRAQLGAAADALAEGLRRHGLSPEAAEDPQILLQRIERIAAQVQSVLRRPAEHPPVALPDDDDTGVSPDPEATEAAWDERYKHNRRQQERLQRAIEERRGSGDDDEAAFKKALDDLALDVPGDEDDAEDEAWEDDEPGPFVDDLDGEDEPDEDDFDEDEDEEPFAKEDRHPLLRRAMDLLHELHDNFEGADRQDEPALNTLFHGAGDAMGGLAQALSGRTDRENDAEMYGLRLSQLKRAQRGAAFARGALLLLRGAVTPEQFQDLYGKIGRLEQDIFQEIGRLRSEQQGS